MQFDPTSLLYPPNKFKTLHAMWYHQPYYLPNKFKKLYTIWSDQPYYSPNKFKSTSILLAYPRSWNPVTAHACEFDNNT